MVNILFVIVISSHLFQMWATSVLAAPGRGKNRSKDRLAEDRIGREIGQRASIPHLRIARVRIGRAINQPSIPRLRIARAIGQLSIPPSWDRSSQDRPRDRSTQHPPSQDRSSRDWSSNRSTQYPPSQDRSRNWSSDRPTHRSPQDRSSQGWPSQHRPPTDRSRDRSTRRSRSPQDWSRDRSTRHRSPQDRSRQDWPKDRSNQYPPPQDQSKKMDVGASTSSDMHQSSRHRPDSTVQNADKAQNEGKAHQVEMHPDDAEYPIKDIIEVDFLHRDPTISQVVDLYGPDLCYDMVEDILQVIETRLGERVEARANQVIEEWRKDPEEYNTIERVTWWWDQLDNHGKFSAVSDFRYAPGSAMYEDYHLLSGTIFTTYIKSAFVLIGSEDLINTLAQEVREPTPIDMSLREGPIEEKIKERGMRVLIEMVSREERQKMVEDIQRELSKRDPAIEYYGKEMLEEHRRYPEIFGITECVACMYDALVKDWYYSKISGYPRTEPNPFQFYVPEVCKKEVLGRLRDQADAKAKIDADAKVKANADAKAKADADVKATEADADAKSDADANRTKADADAKARTGAGAGAGTQANADAAHMARKRRQKASRARKIDAKNTLRAQAQANAQAKAGAGASGS
ncbi:hypothetical protein EV360DRAFT_88125 [Lentinula raphanica]|nr:hypothetical protein EV360DRAFT_88125 [Lentinula raphanica]